MSEVVFVQEGCAIDYTPVADVAAGDVVAIGSLMGVAKKNIVANQLGALAVEGVFDFPKADGATTAINVGLDVYWDATAKEATTDDASGANARLGHSVTAASDDDETVRVRLNP